MNRCLSALRRWPIAIGVVVLSGIGAAPAGASTEIEKVWSFNGGEVAIHAVAGGKLVGVVVTPTKFDECTHQAGEEMWTGIAQQPDGSYWGFHQWFFEKSCAPNPTLGPTAWRVLQKPGGVRDLLVCFSEPGGPQPTIAANGTTANASRPCEESKPTGALPVVASNGAAPAGGGEVISFANTIALPKSRSCVARGTLRLALHEPKQDPLKEVVVKIKRRKIADVHGVQRLKSGFIVLRGLPSGTYTLKVTAITALDQKLSGRRTYHACGRRRHRHGRRRGR